jgi:hypothetical protein
MAGSLDQKTVANIFIALKGLAPPFSPSNLPKKYHLRTNAKFYTKIKACTKFITCLLLMLDAAMEILKFEYSRFDLK